MRTRPSSRPSGEIRRREGCGSVLRPFPPGRSGRTMVGQGRTAIKRRHWSGERDSAASLALPTSRLKPDAADFGPGSRFVHHDRAG